MPDNSIESPQDQVRELIDHHPTLYDSDFSGGLHILCERRGIVRGLLKFVSAYLTALRLCYEHGYGFDPDMALKFLNATLNWQRRLRHDE